jgi:hypothetical protein
MEYLTRICTSCGIEKPLTAEFFYHRKDRNIWNTRCSECLKAKQYEYRGKKRDPDKWSIKINPDTYSNDEQRQEVFDFLIKLGWTYRPARHCRERGIWYKEPLKTIEGKWRISLGHTI